jgi:hypothetical protein
VTVKRKWSIVYGVQEFCAVVCFGTPHPLSRAKWLPHSVFLLPGNIARLHSFVGKGAGGPKSYDSTETLVHSILYQCFGSGSGRIRIILPDPDPDRDWHPGLTDPEPADLNRFQFQATEKGDKLYFLSKKNF